MRFIDEVTIDIAAGSGGNGAVAFRREKYVPMGGPSGGDGGNGGDVVLHARTRLSTLLDLQFQKHIRAPSGESGRSKDQFGKGGENLDVSVPVGTQVFDDDTDELLFDLDHEDASFVVARGGRGGRGNIRFVSASEQAPRRAEPGEPGERRRIRFELKLLADVGVVGFPNVGKSTLIATISRARPKIADYPFTTLVPNLGVVSLGIDRNFVVADIPGIIEGAHKGAGLGIQFLRHVERTKVLLHLITVSDEANRDPISDFDKLNHELREFSAELADRPMIVGVSKTDLTDVSEQADAVVAEMKKRGYEVFAFSSATRSGIDPLLLELERIVRR